MLLQILTTCRPWSSNYLDCSIQIYLYWISVYRILFVYAFIWLNYTFNEQEYYLLFFKYFYQLEFDNNRLTITCFENNWQLISQMIGRISILDFAVSTYYECFRHYSQKVFLYVMFSWVSGEPSNLVMQLSKDTTFHESIKV